MKQISLILLLFFSSLFFENIFIFVNSQSPQKITCYFTADNEIVNVYLNGADITNRVYPVGSTTFSASALKDLSIVKYVEFDEPSADVSTFAFKLKDAVLAAPYWSAFFLGCISSGTTGPWTQLVSSLDTNIWAAFSSQSASESNFYKKVSQNILNFFPPEWYSSSLPGTSVLVRSSVPINCNHHHCVAGLNNELSPHPQRVWTSDESKNGINYSYIGLRATIRKKPTQSYCRDNDSNKFLSDFMTSHYCKDKNDFCDPSKYKDNQSTQTLSYRTCIDTKDSAYATCQPLKTVIASVYLRDIPAGLCHCAENAWDSEYYDMITPDCTGTSKLTNFMHCDNWEYDYNDDWDGESMTRYFGYNEVLFRGFDLTKLRCDDDENCRGSFCPTFGTFNDPIVIANTENNLVPWDQCERKCPYGYYCNEATIAKCAPGYICDKVLCNGNFYCEYGNVPRQCNSGCYCPTHPEKKITVEINCGLGNYCPLGSSTQTKCPVGNYCEGEYSSAPKFCPSGTYCLDIGLSSAPTCPPGYYCANGGGSTPLPCTKDQPCNKFLGATAKANCNAGSDCDRFFETRSIQTRSIDSVFGQSNTITSKAIFSELYKYGNNQIVLEKGQVIINGENSGSFFGAWLQLGSNNDITVSSYGKLILKNVNQIGGKIILSTGSVLVLESSTASFSNIVLNGGEGESASIIILRGSSHLLGVNTKIGSEGILIYDIPSKVIIEFDGDASASIIGCDSMPSCDSAPFLNITKSDKWRNKISPYASDTLSSASSMKVLTSVGSSQERRKMVIKSLLSCAVNNQGIHKPSTYVTRALYCAVKDTSDSFDSRQTFKEAQNVIDYVTANHAIDNNEKSLLTQTKQIAIERITINGIVVSGGYPVAPRLSLDFLVGSKGPKRGTIDYLLDSFDQIDTNINSITSIMLDTVNNLKNLQSKDLSDRLQRYAIAKAQAETGKLVAQAQIDAANQAINILLNRAKSAYVLADSLTKQLYPILKQAYDEIDELLSDDLFSFFTKLITSVTNMAFGAATVLFGNVEGGLLAMEGAFQYTELMIELSEEKDTDYKDLLNSKTLKYIGMLFNNLDEAIKEIGELEKDLKERLNDKTVGFNLPKIRWKINADYIISEVMEAGCNDHDPEDVPSCGAFKNMVQRIADAQIELSEITNSLIDLVQTREIAKTQISRYSQLIETWSQKYITDTYNEQLSGLDFIAQLGGQLSEVQKVLQASLSRLQIYSLTMVKNGQQALDSLCRAAAYYNPQNYGDSKWITLCQTPTSQKVTIQSISKNIQDFLNYFGEMPDPQNWQDVSLEITNLVNLKKFKEDIEKAGPNENPNITLSLTPEVIPNTNILSCTENVALQWVGFYLTNKATGALSIPNPTSIQIKLTTPFIKKAGGKQYFFDFKEKLYDISYAPGDTINTLYEPSPSDLLDTFARPSVFATYTILRRAGKVFDSSADFRAWLLIKYTGKSIPNCNTGTDCTLLSKANCVPAIGCSWVKNKCQVLLTKSPVKAPTKKPIASPTKKPIISGGEVTCSFTVDNIVKEFWVNGVNLTPNVIGDLSDWTSIKTITFTVPTKYPQVIAIKGSDLESASAANAGLMFKCTSNIATKWNFTSKPGSGWKSYCSNSETFPSGWYLSKVIKGETVPIQSTSPFGMNGVEIDGGDKLWCAGTYQHAGFKKVIK